jgi:DNA-binding IclR family transcriptional regulator
MSASESWHVTRTLRALEALAMGPHSAVEVADALGIHPRTARRLLNRLVSEGYLTRGPEPRRKYVATLRVVALAGQVAEHSELVLASRATLRRLHEETGATAHLTVPSLVCALCLLHAGEHDALPVPSIGERIPAHATAAGKALLAQRPRWRSHVLRQPLERYTDATLVEPAALEAELEAVAERGWALEDGEYRATMRAVAAPVRGHDGQVVAALGVSGAIELERCPDLGALIAQMAAAISEAIGYAESEATVEEPSRG